MTREESKNKARCSWDVFELIDKIYDDFESRTCDKCKHGTESWITVDGQDIRESQYPPMIICNQVEIKEYLYPDFGCNKWVSKYD